MLRSLTALLLLALPAMAEEGALQGLRTADDVKGWQAVGKLLLGDRGFCTGALIAPRLVVTAAHCLYDKGTGARVPDDLITFQAGWRIGRAEAYRGVSRSVTHPDYLYSGEDELERVGYDLALLELDQPILLPQLTPYDTAALPATGALVNVVSYALDRSELPSIERGCSILSEETSAVILSCDIDFGSSGAPVFSDDGAGPKLVSVISAKAEYGGRKVALAVPLAGPLATLQAELAAGPASRVNKGATVRVISGGGGGGAKFVSP